MNDAGGITEVLAETALWLRVDAKPMTLTRYGMRGIPPPVDIVDRRKPDIITLGMDERVIHARKATRAGVSHFRCYGTTSEQRRNEN
jgi:hypothetical protein